MFEKEIEKARDYDHMTDYFKMFALTTLILALFILSSCMVVPLAESAERDYSKAVIHHSDSPCWTTVNDIDRWHKERGWDGIGYHWVIGCDGSVYAGRAYEKHGAHARTGKPYSRNNRTGIVLIGKESFSDAQIESLNTLIDELNIVEVDRHHEECPGPGIRQRIVKK